MKRIIIIVLILASIGVYSQSLNRNNSTIRIVDSTMGLGITPTSRLHVFGNGTTSNLFNLVNDKDATKDSSVIVDAVGNVGIGKTPLAKLHVNGFVNIDSSLTVDNNIYLSNLFSRISFNRGGYITSPSFLCRFEDMGITIDSALYYAVHDIRALSFDNDTTISLGNYHLNIDNYTGNTGIGTYRPLYRLDIGAGGTTNINSEVVRINSSNAVGVGSSLGFARADTIRGGIGISPGASPFNENDFFIQSNWSSNIVLTTSLSEKHLEIDQNGNLITYKEIIWRDSVGDYVKGTTLSDNEAFALPTGYSWKGEIDVDSLGITLFTAQIRCDADGTPYLEGVSWKRWSSITYVEVGSTAGYFNVTDGGSGMVIANTLGYTIKATLRFRTKQ